MPHNMIDALNAMGEEASRKQSERRSRIFLDAAIESLIVDVGVNDTVATLKAYVEQLAEFETD